MTRVDKPPLADVGRKLQAALTEDQIQILLNVVAEAGHLKAVGDRLRAADPDLADAVRKILEEPRTHSAAAPSSQKTIEIWNDLWATWTDHVAEVGSEEGPYVNHEEHWHPPYFDQTALADDLEEAAGQLSGWIDRAFPLVEEPNLFLESLAELHQNIQSYPEWFQPVDDVLVLGPRATSCVLRWTWLGLVDRSAPGRELVDFLRNLETKSESIGLDCDACFQFFKALPKTICGEIHAYLREPKFEGCLRDLRSSWHRIQHEYEKRFDPSAHRRACEEHLEEDWRYGEPLIADAISRGDLAAAESFIERTLSSLLRWSGEGPWRPEKLLLPQHPYYRPPEEDQAKERLLHQWEDIAARRGNAERVASLRLQRAVLRSPEDWAVVLAAFQEYQRGEGKPAVAGRLFTEWQQRMASACMQQEGRKEDTTDTWIHRLIDAQRNPASDQIAFLEHMEVWLECCQKHAAFFAKNWPSLALLTRNLPRHRETQKRCPTFHSHVLAQAMQVSKELEQSLRDALASLGNKAKLIEVRPVWERHLHTLVRSPGESGSYYRDSALGMKALSEVNPTSYDSLLARWKTEFRRRRNLWADMTAVGCPGL